MSIFQHSIARRDPLQDLVIFGRASRCPSLRCGSPMEIIEGKSH